MTSFSALLKNLLFVFVQGRGRPAMSHLLPSVNLTYIVNTIKNFSEKTADLS